MDRDQRGFPQSAYRTAASPPGVWQSGGLLVMERTAVLPARCIRCNREVSSLWQQEIRVSPLWRAGVFVYPLLGGNPMVPLCEEHQEEIRRKRAAARVWLLISVLLLVLAIASVNNRLLSGVAMLAVLVTIAIALAAIFRSLPVQVKRRTDRHIWFGDVNPDFLSTLPLAPPELS